jgi:hypothetical protein
MSLSGSFTAKINAGTIYAGCVFPEGLFAQNVKIVRRGAWKNLI